MKRFVRFVILLISVALSACSNNRSVTLQSLNDRGLDVKKSSVSAGSRDKVMKSYQKFLNEAPANHPMYSGALNRLADLEVISADDKLYAEKEQKYQEVFELVSKQDEKQTRQSYKAAVKLYEGLLKANPKDPRNDKVLYQLARAYETNAEIENALRVLSQLVKRYPDSQYFLEAQFRRGEASFLLEKYITSEHAYKSVLKYGRKNVYYKRALYKYAWSLFKQEQYENALRQFFQLMNNMPVVYGRQGQVDYQALSKVDKNLVEDVFRAINLCFSYAGNAEYVSAYFGRFSSLPFEYEVFNRLGDYLLEKDRIKDAADTYGAFVLRKPFHPMAATLQIKRIAAFDKGRFRRSAMKARQSFMEGFGAGSRYWARQSEENREMLSPLFKQTLTELTEYYHAKLQKRRRPAYFIAAIKWYQAYIKMFPGDPDAAKMEFLLGELYAENKKYIKAATVYERAAFSYGEHPRAKESAYAVIDISNRLYRSGKGKDKHKWRLKRLDFSLNYLKKYPAGKKHQSIRMKATEELFALKRYAEAETQANILVANMKITQKNKSSALIILGHIAFENKDYLMAKSQYQSALATGISNKEIKSSVQERLLASTFQYAEVLRENKQYEDAVTEFIAVNTLSPKSSMAINALYDAASIHFNQAQWKKAIKLLLEFRGRYKNHKLQSGVTDKLAVAYEKSGQLFYAAKEVLTISNRNLDVVSKQNAIWQAASLYEKSGRMNEAITNYKKYVRSLSEFSEQSFEGRQKLIDLYLKAGDSKKRDYWLRDVIKSHKKYNNKLSDRSKYIVADASIILANEKMVRYQKAKLNLPLRKSLRKKKRLMKTTLDAYENVSKIGVAEFSTASTFQVAEVYQQLGESIMTSQRPNKLSNDEREEYDLLLEEQAFPFEEKAIEIHEVNVSRIRDGIYDDWIKRSMGKLALVQPVRYGKVEQHDEVYSALD